MIGYCLIGYERWKIETKEKIRSIWEKSGLKSNPYKITKSLFAIRINSIFEGSPVGWLITQSVNQRETLGCLNQSIDQVINHPIGKLKAMLKIHLLRAEEPQSWRGGEWPITFSKVAGNIQMQTHL